MFFALPFFCPGLPAECPLSPPVERERPVPRLERSVATMTTAVHNVDQRSPVVSIEHAALPCVVECEQYGPGHAKFVADTSSVIWACGKLLPQHLCEHPDEVRGKRCCELGAGIGLAGATAFALGATDVLLTDCAPAVPLLQLNAERNAAANGGASGSLRAQELQWGDQAQIDAAGRGAYDVLLGADIVYHQSAEEMALLATTIASLLAPGGVMLLAYEWREDWETTDAFHTECEARGLSLHRSQLCDADEEDQVLFTLRWLDTTLPPPTAAERGRSLGAAWAESDAQTAEAEAPAAAAPPTAPSEEPVARCRVPCSVM